MKQLTNLNFRKAEPDDARWCNALRNDPDVVCNLQDQMRYSTEECRLWLSNLGQKSERWIFSRIEEPSKGNKKFGLFRVDDIDYQNRHCAVGLDIHKDHRGKGLAIPTYKIMLEYLFYQRNFNRVWLEVLLTNEIAINLYKKIGFQDEGKLREFYFRNGSYHDVFRMSLGRSEFYVK